MLCGEVVGSLFIDRVCREFGFPMLFEHLELPILRVGDATVSVDDAIDADPSVPFAVVGNSLDIVVVLVLVVVVVVKLFVELDFVIEFFVGGVVGKSE